MTSKNATVLMSGGIDSTACAHFLHSAGFSVRGLFIDYGQAARSAEARAVQAAAQHLACQVTSVSVLLGREFAAGELTGRNAFLISTALFAGISRPGVLAIGIHAGTPYFDCSEAFFEAIARLVSEQTDGTVTLIAPFLNWTKGDVFNYFTASQLPVSVTYSCESGGEEPCGLCASCRDREALGC